MMPPLPRIREFRGQNQRYDAPCPELADLGGETDVMMPPLPPKFGGRNTENTILQSTRCGLVKHTTQVIG
ncbi:hypothetical protein Cyast_2825 [Cyanobacterium stanieri PCC 7202]|uniref:Uncharacterized protein n=1 Tax=Cyanobacterium stanieri (strain ATCC 29140 / PCC 7202) TaxID=292563 RepID=K9YP97_CYASC|nr:hypothetical protein Cyast_2825 [Cyanobacterium stanieri PCC 7202]